jgi:hypothetical protein
MGYGFRDKQQIFAGLRDHLKPGGRVYYAQGNYGAIDKALVLMKGAGSSIAW